MVGTRNNGNTIAEDSLTFRSSCATSRLPSAAGITKPMNDGVVSGLIVSSLRYWETYRPCLTACCMSNSTRFEPDWLNGLRIGKALLCISGRSGKTGGWHL